MESGISREKWKKLEDKIRGLEEQKGVFQDGLFGPWAARWE